MLIQHMLQRSYSAAEIGAMQKKRQNVHDAGFFPAFFLVDLMVRNSGHHVFLRGQRRGGSIWANNFDHDCHVLLRMHDTANLYYFPMQFALMEQDVKLLAK